MPWLMSPAPCLASPSSSLCRPPSVPLSLQFDYYVRMDSDSEFKKPIGFDIMVRRGACRGPLYTVYPCFAFVAYAAGKHAALRVALRIHCVGV